MTNVEKLQTIGILGIVRQRLGAINENDVNVDKTINQMDSSQIVYHWAEWYLGDGGWWFKMKNYYDRLEKMTNSQKQNINASE